MAVTAQMVKELREMTGAGMMDCKKALVEVDGNIEAAVDYLKEKGLAKAAKKAGRVAAEGLVKIAFTDDHKTAAIVEVNSETDFVSKNEEFVNFVDDLAKLALTAETNDIEAFKAMAYEGSTVADVLTAKIAKIGENMSIRRIEKVSGDVVASYIHGGGSVGVLVSFDTNAADNAEFVAMGKNIAMQVAAMSPAYLDEASVPADVVEKERVINLAQMNEDPKMANKPEQVKAKIIEGKIKKFYTEVCLLDQTFVRSDLFDGSVSGYVAQVAKEIGADIKVTGFVRLAKGEGIEKRQDDLAEEVAKLIK